MGPFRIKSIIKGRYRILRIVDRGGFAFVYRAYEAPLRRYVAIKALAPQGGLSEDAERRFLMEARKLAKLRSPHVVTVHTTGKQDGVRFFVMEYLPFSLDRLIEDFDGGPVSADIANRILKQTLEGLAAVHHAGWIHRDIKPANILLTADEEVRLADFGLMRDPGSPLTTEGWVGGTPNWMAPEQMAGKVSSQTDVYAFGLVACQMIAGPHWHVDGPVDLAQYTDAGTARLVAKCLEAEPSRRPKDADLVLKEWTRIEERLRRKRRRSRIRGHALVGNARARIEREYGLPRGSVRLVYPGKRRAVRADVKVSRVREMWGE